MLNITIVLCAIFTVTAAHWDIPSHWLKGLRKLNSPELIKEAQREITGILEDSMLLKEFSEKFIEDVDYKALKHVREATKRNVNSIGYGECFTNVTIEIDAIKETVSSCISESAKSVNPSYVGVENLKVKVNETFKGLRKKILECSDITGVDADKGWECIVSIFKEVVDNYRLVVKKLTLSKQYQWEEVSRQYASGTVMCKGKYDISKVDTRINSIAKEYEQCLRERSPTKVNSNGPLEKFSQ